MRAATIGRTTRFGRVWSDRSDQPIVCPWTCGFSDPFEVYVDGDDVTPTSPNQRILLGVLAAHPDRHVRLDT